MKNKIKEFEYSGKAMGTEYNLAVVCGSYSLAKEVFKKAQDDIEAYEARFSRFLPTSELSRLNKKGHMTVSQTFLEATQKAYELFLETQGVFNPLVQISRLGYDRSFNDPLFNKNRSKDNAPKNDDDYDVDFSTVVINPQTSHVHLQKGQKLDFGGFLKGYLAEIIARDIVDKYPDVQGVVVNLGGDIHSRGLDENGNHFVFSIYNPVLKDDELYVSLSDQSLATSGTYKRSWLNSDLMVHHILDASGKNNPETNIVSASVIHPDGARADAYAKVFLSKDPESSFHLLGEKNISYITINNQGLVSKNI